MSTDNSLKLANMVSAVNKAYAEAGLFDIGFQDAIRVQVFSIAKYLVAMELDEEDVDEVVNGIKHQVKSAFSAIKSYTEHQVNLN